jgi:uncharacterized protein with HEPN domain
VPHYYFWEATKRLSKEFRGQHPTIPWKEIAGMHDVITHDYDEVDFDEVSCYTFKLH